MHEYCMFYSKFIDIINLKSKPKQTKVYLFILYTLSTKLANFFKVNLLSILYLFISDPHILSCKFISPNTPAINLLNRSIPKL